MKNILIFITLFFSTIFCYGKRVYSIPKSDFIIQFSDSIKLFKVYCFNENGKKVWLSINQNTQLTLKMSDDKKIILLLNTIKYENGNLNAVEYNVWLPSRKVSHFKIEDVKSFTIERNFQENEFPFFNLDSISKVVRFKNDSLKSNYLSRSEYILKLIKKVNSETLSIRQNSCYNITFKNNNKIQFGIIEKITQDSIYITSSLNKNMAKASKIDFKLFKYLINDIVQIDLLKSSGFSFNNIKIEEFKIIVKKVDKKKTLTPIWFAINPRNGEIKLYRSWLTNSGYVGITESNGKPIWYEGENTQ